MKVQCPNCKATYNIDDSKIPEKGTHATCSKCKTRIEVKKKPKESAQEASQIIITCPNCGHVNISSEKCAQCGKVFSEEDKKKLGIEIQI
jgi:predicted Zn finger-like uncharacterized protein